MSDFVDERRYAWRMICAARKAHAAGIRIDGAAMCRDEIIALLEDALDAGLDRTEIVIELANLGARFFTLCDPGRAVVYDVAVEDAEICLN